MPTTSNLGYVGRVEPQRDTTPTVRGVSLPRFGVLALTLSMSDSFYKRQPIRPNAAVEIRQSVTISSPIVKS